MRRALAALALVGALCSLSTATADRVSASAPPRCNASTTLVAYADTGNGFAGTIVVPFEVINVGAHTCWVLGFPLVRFVAAGPLPRGARVIDVAGNGPLAVVAARRIVLAPRQVGSFGIEYSDVLTGYDASRPGCRVKQVQITLPLLASTRTFVFNYVFNICFAGYVVARTPIEGRV